MQANSIRQNAVEHLLALHVDEDVTRLEQAVEKYRAQTGRLPANFADLERAGFIDAMPIHGMPISGSPIDPKGHAYKLMPDGRIEVQNPEKLYFITKGLPPGMETPQPHLRPHPAAK